MENKKVDFRKIIPGQGSEGTWIGRCWVPENKAYNGVEGPHVVQVKNKNVYDLSAYFHTTSELINSPNVISKLHNLENLPLLGSLETVLENSHYTAINKEEPRFISPNDIQSVKACGVTFVKSLLERVVEEKARGDAKKAATIRETIYNTIGKDLSKVIPGSPETNALKEQFQKAGFWSQYLEVGIGKDAEVFTKGQPLSSVGFGAEIGVLKDSIWNNPEPEIVLAVSSKGKIVGATLGNDVNLRDYEGRSALLLGEAKDQNGSCSIGPLFRLFDATFCLDDVENCEVELNIIGEDTFVSKGANKMNEISRSPQDLVNQVVSENHQYPDGIVLFLGTMFSPSEDRVNEGEGFTHKVGDRVEISSQYLGTLINWVNTCEQLPPWEFGVNSLINFIIKRSN